jgi:hypothetical protein
MATAEYHRKWRAAHPGSQAKTDLKYSLAHPEKRRASWTHWRKRFPEKYFNHLLKKNYGITSDQYRDMMDRQAGGCAVCGSETSDIIGRRLHVDHCHETGRVRGLLCANCNLAIGKLQDSPDLFLRAAEYLRSH